MSKELITGTLDQAATKYEAKIEDGKLKVTTETDLIALVDKGAELVPGDNPIELMVVQAIKMGIRALG